MPYSLSAYQFYHEFASRSRDVSNKTCLAVLAGRPDSRAVGAKSNSRVDIGRTSASTAYLMTCCLPISEAEARVIHPELFCYLDSVAAAHV